MRCSVLPPQSNFIRKATVCLLSFIPICAESEAVGMVITMKEVPIWEKSNLSLEEAAAYSSIGINKLRDLTNEKDCRFVLWVGNKRLIKRRLFDQFIEQMYSI